MKLSDGDILELSIAFRLQVAWITNEHIRDRIMHLCACMLDQTRAHTYNKTAENIS